MGHSFQTIRHVGHQGPSISAPQMKHRWGGLLGREEERPASSSASGRGGGGPEGSEGDETGEGGGSASGAWAMPGRVVVEGGAREGPPRSPPPGPAGSTPGSPRGAPSETLSSSDSCSALSVVLGASSFSRRSRRKNPPMVDGGQGRFDFSIARRLLL